MGFENRTEIPRCQIGIYEDDREYDCGEPSVAFWEWGEGDPLFVCEHHNEFVERCELKCGYKS